MVSLVRPSSALGYAARGTLLIMLAPAVLLAASTASPEFAAVADGGEAWSIERMLEEYGESYRRSAPTWPMILTMDVNTTERSGASDHVDSWLGGVSQYYGAGGVSPIDSSAGVLTSRFNTMVPGFGESGARSLRPRPNTTLDDASLRSRNSLLNRVETTLWAGNIFRDNMITVFGYVLNLPNTPLNAELYTSLYRIYEEVRYRRFQTVPLVRTLREMCQHSPTNQFKNLFREMKKVSRPYMTSAIDFWIDALESEMVNMDEILRPKGGPLVVDFLEGIDPSVLKELVHPPEFPEETQKHAEPEAKLLMGSVVANTLAAITDGNLPLTQTLFALLLQSRPVDTVVPQRIESERYISDSLRLRKVKGWRKITKRAESERARGNYYYSRAILWAIAESSDVEPSLQDAARLVYTYIEPPGATYSNTYYNYASSIMCHPTIDILQILNAITPSEYPEDVVDAKNRLKYYIESGYLDMEFVVKGFNRFDHIKPINLVIAILKRIEMRLPKIPHEIKSSVKYLKVYLIFKKFLCTMSPNIPKYFLDAPFLLDSFEGPNMPKRIHKLVKKLEASLRKEHLPVEKLMAEIPIQECSRPRQCILNAYRRVVKHNYIKGRARDLMEALITSFDITGEPLSPPIHPEFEVKTDKKKKCSKNRNKEWGKIVSIPTTSPKPTSPKIILTSLSTTNKISELSTQSHFSTASPDSTNQDEDELIFHQDFIIYPGTPEPPLQFPIYKETELKEKPEYSAPITLLPMTEIGTIEDIKIRPIREFFKLPNLYLMLGYSFRPELYTTKLQLIIAILKRCINLSIVKFDTILHSSMKEFLSILQNLPRRPQTINQSIFPNLTDDFESEEVNYQQPYKNLPKCSPSSIECDKIYPIRLFLNDEYLYYKLGPYFKPSLYRTKGEFIQALLTHSLNTKYVQKNALLYRSIKQFLSYLEEAQIDPVEVHKIPFPKGDVIKDYEPPNWERPLTLLPHTVHGTPEHIKMRPLRLFFARPDFWTIMGLDFNPQVYPSKGVLLSAIVKQALTRQWVRENTQLYSTLSQYNDWLAQSQTIGGTSPMMSILLTTLIKALPYPETTEEELFLRKIRDLFQNKYFLDAVLPSLGQVHQLTRGATLQKVLTIALEKQDMYQLDETTRLALNYFKDKVFHEGYGAQSVDYVVPKTTIIQIKISLLDLLRAIDHAKLSSNDRNRVKRLINFISSWNFDPNKYLNGFQFEKYQTNGEFLNGAFQHMSKLDYIRPRLRSDMMFLKNYIMLNGPGAEHLVKYS